MCGIAGFSSFKVDYMSQREHWLKVLLNMNRCRNTEDPMKMERCLRHPVDLPMSGYQFWIWPMDISQ